MIVEINGVKHYVHWRHINTKSKKGTQVFISTTPFNKENPTDPLVTAKSYLHKNDVYEKNKGRIVSLTKALAKHWNGHENKSIRSLFWDKYREMRAGSIA